jgi:hypothetical protein
VYFQGTGALRAGWFAGDPGLQLDGETERLRAFLQQGGIGNHHQFARPVALRRHQCDIRADPCGFAGGDGYAGRRHVPR